MKVNSNLSYYRNLIDNISVNDTLDNDKIFKHKNGSTYDIKKLNGYIDKVRNTNGDPELKEAIIKKITGLIALGNEKLAETAQSVKNIALTHINSDGQKASSSNSQTIQATQPCLPSEIIGKIISKNSSLRDFCRLAATPMKLDDQGQPDYKSAGNSIVGDGIKWALAVDKMVVSEDSGFANIEQLKGFLKVYGDAVRKLDLRSYSRYIDDVSLTEIVSLTPYLEHLGLDYCINITEGKLAKLKFPNLKELHMSGTHITGYCLKDMNLQRLEMLNLHGCYYLKDDELANFKDHKIKVIDLGLTEINGSCLAKMNLVNLQDLNLSSCKELKESELEKLQKHSLKVLNLTYTSINGSCLKKMKLDSLEELCLADSAATDEGLDNTNIPKLKIFNLSNTRIMGLCFETMGLDNLEDLNLSQCYGIYDEALEKLQKHSLKVLDLTYISINGSCLKKMKLDRLENLFITSSKIEERFLVDFNTPNLKNLSLNGAPITGDCLTNLNSLEYLDLSDCKKLQEDKIQKITQNNPNLKDLRLSGAPITGDCLTNLSSVEYLDLSDCKKLQEDKIQKIIQNNPNLKDLSLSKTPITGYCLTNLSSVEYLDLSDCKKLQEDELQNIIAPCLTILNLESTDITGSCFEKMQMQSIEEIDLSYCKYLKNDVKAKLNSHNLYGDIIGSSYMIFYRKGHL